ncbi:hypothetical protein F8M41_002811 [Gigaspora margarita]|uniref:Restriction endonuclease type IV Mrr domain-containing protein n=1 Tax=Gigaspora margarita TaxID=4874 RepID=A0A8H4AYC6_GIGMA|nr:hypothetical protein F8M41_002811 [Gigaspora margarita]
MLGNMLEWDALSELKGIGFVRRENLDALTWVGMEYVHTGGVGDGGIDIFCQVAGRIVFPIQCKNYSRKGSVDRDIVYAHTEVTRRCAKKYGVVAVGIVVVPSMDSFSADAKEAAETAEGVVIFLSTKDQIPRYILPSVVNSRTGALTHFILP